MATYTSDVDVVGGGGWGGVGWGGGGIGLIILLFLFFAIFSGGLFGRDRREDGREEPHNWFIDRDILETRYSVANGQAASTAEIVANQNAIAARQVEAQLADAKATILHERTLRAISDSENRTEKEIGWVKSHMAQKPEVYAAAYLPAGVGYPAQYS